jgi:4-carboxymuconolactone decarboxylase
MTASAPREITLPVLDEPTKALVRLSAVVTAGTEADVRSALAACNAAATSDVWIEELILQSYLFAGFPRALNAAREWRKARGVSQGDSQGDSYGDSQGEAAARSPNIDDIAPSLDGWRERGEATCATVYGRFYEKLRANIAGLHPALDDWMIVDGYGKVLGRPGLDLARRELCIIAACVAAGQDRQLHSHLHGALHAGAAAEAITDTLSALYGVVDAGAAGGARMLWARVRGK